MGQEDSIVIKTDRPGFSDYPRTIPTGYMQIESGFFFERETVTAQDSRQLINWNNTLIKYGLADGLELRLGQTYQSERLLEGGQSPQFIWQSVSGPVVVGTKINLTEAKGFIPMMAIVAEYGFNTYRIETNLNNSFYRAQLLGIYELNPDWTLMMNLGIDKSFNDFARLRYTLNTGYSISEKLALYMEIYGFQSQNTPLNYFDGGLTYLVSPKLQIDIHAGFDLVQQYNNIVAYQQSFIAFGFGYLFDLSK